MFGVLVLVSAVALSFGLVVSRSIRALRRPCRLLILSFVPIDGTGWMGLAAAEFESGRSDEPRG